MSYRPLSDGRPNVRSRVRELYYQLFGNVMMTTDSETQRYHRRYGMPRIREGSGFQSIEDYVPEELAKVLSRVDYTKNPNRCAYSIIFRAIILFRKTSGFKVRVFTRKSYIKVAVGCREFSLSRRLTLKV